MSRRYHNRRTRKFFAPPQDAPWVWLPLDLMCSEAWRSRSINCGRLIEFLIVEHGNHAARENGNLCAPYDQLEAAGLTRSCIQAAVSEAEALGLLKVVRGGRWAGTNLPSRYRLTFFASYDGAPATNDWKAVDKRKARAFQRDQSERRNARARWRRNLKNQVLSSTNATLVVR